MATNQNPPKKIMKAPKGTMTPPSRKNMLERVDKVIKNSMKPKPRTSPLKSALAKGDRISAAQSFTARAAKKVAMGVGKAINNAKPNTTKIDSVKKVTPIGGSKPSIMIKKETKIRKPLVGGSIPFPDRPAKPESSKGKGVSLIKVSVGKIKK
jgi:hypothetical protein